MPDASLILSFQNGKHDEAWMVLKQVHDTNMRAKGHPERVFSVGGLPPPPLPPPRALCVCQHPCCSLGKGSSG